MRIALVEQDICGGGASGRNGGFFSSSWWMAASLADTYGEEEALRYATACSDAVAEAERFCAEQEIDCGFHREGFLGARTNASQRRLGGGGDWLEAHGEGGRILPRTALECRAVADSPRFLDGIYVPDSAVVQPARLARGLRRVALERGVRIFERTEVTGLERSRPAIVRTRHGAVRADQVVLTMGSWGAGWPSFRRSFGVIVDYVVVTEPIPERLEGIGWTTNVGIGDARDLLYYLRPTDDRRIAIGGGALGVAFRGRASGRAVTHDRRVAEAAARGLIWLFPQLEGVRFTHAWGGPIDQTPTSTPFFKTLEPGNVHAGLGFSGHGLAQTHVGGKILSSLVQGARDAWSTLPVVGAERAKMPPEPLRWASLRAASWALQTGDRLEDRGRPRGQLLTWLGNEAPSTYRDVFSRPAPQ